MDQLNVQQNWLSIPGVEKHTGTDTIDFFFHEDKPKDRNATYVR